MDRAECLAAAGVWLAKAASDLASVKVLIHGDEPHLDTGSFHCQQCAETTWLLWRRSGRIKIIPVGGGRS